MLRLVLYHGFTKHLFESDPSFGAETLFYQVFSLTNVPPEDITLYGVGTGPLTLATAAGTVLDLHDGLELAMMEPFETLTDERAGVMGGVIAWLLPSLRPLPLL